MNLFIPTTGTKLILNKEWTFLLHDEYRNWKFWKDYLGIEPNPQNESYHWYSLSHGNKPVSVTLPVNTILMVDRIYIRKGKKDYDSITFRTLKGSPAGVPIGRFWVKLSDVNHRVEFSLI